MANYTAADIKSLREQTGAGMLDVKKALAAEKSMRDFIKTKYSGLVDEVEGSKDLSSDNEKKLHDAIKDWKKAGAF